MKDFTPIFNYTRSYVVSTPRINLTFGFAIMMKVRHNKRIPQPSQLQRTGLLWKYVQIEAQFAIELEKIIIPIIMDDTALVRELAEYQWIDFRPFLREREWRISRVFDYRDKHWGDEYREELYRKLMSLEFLNYFEPEEIERMRSIVGAQLTEEPERSD